LRRRPPPAAPLYTEVGPYDWSGAYIGANVGYGWGKSDFRDAEYNGGHTIFPIVNWDVTSRGLIYGMQAGYNVQRGSFVYGVEGELGYLNLKGATLQPGLDPYGDPYDAYGTVKGGAYGSINLRLGHAVDRTLFFAKAGVVYSDAKIGFYDDCTTGTCGPGLIDAVDKLGFGYQVGAGVEHALTEKWTIKVEYTFLDFGNANPRGIVGAGGGFFGQTKGVEGDLSAHTVRVGLNYKF
jgi:outer membrane immunogenic protein